MITKATIIKDTPVLEELVKPKDVPSLDFVIEGERYCGIGCDLRDLQTLDLAIGSVKGLDEALVLCIAEVSITYMDPDASDALIAWARTLSDGKSGWAVPVRKLLIRTRRHIRLARANFTRWSRSSICQNNAEALSETTLSTTTDPQISRAAQSMPAFLRCWMGSCGFCQPMADVE